MVDLKNIPLSVEGRSHTQVQDQDKELSCVVDTVSIPSPPSPPPPAAVIRTCVLEPRSPLLGLSMSHHRQVPMMPADCFDLFRAARNQSVFRLVTRFSVTS